MHGACYLKLARVRSVQKNTSTGIIEVASVVYRVTSIDTESGEGREGGF